MSEQHPKENPSTTMVSGNGELVESNNSNQPDKKNTKSELEAAGDELRVENVENNEDAKNPETVDPENQLSGTDFDSEELADKSEEINKINEKLKYLKNQIDEISALHEKGFLSSEDANQLIDLKNAKIAELQELLEGFEGGNESESKNSDSDTEIAGEIMGGKDGEADGVDREADVSDGVSSETEHKIVEGNDVEKSDIEESVDAVKSSDDDNVDSKLVSGGDIKVEEGEDGEGSDEDTATSKSAAEDSNEEIVRDFEEEREERKDSVEDKEDEKVIPPPLSGVGKEGVGSDKTEEEKSESETTEKSERLREREIFLQEKRKFIEARERYFNVLKEYNENRPWYKKMLGMNDFDPSKPISNKDKDSELYKVNQAYREFMLANAQFKNFCDESGHYDRIKNWMLRRSVKKSKTAKNPVENVKQEKVLKEKIDGEMARLSVERHITSISRERLKLQSTEVPEAAREVLDVLKKHKKKLAATSLAVGVINPLYGTRIIVGGLSAAVVKKAGDLFLTGRYGIFTRSLKEIERMAINSIDSKVDTDILIHLERHYFERSKNKRRAQVATGVAAIVAGGVAAGTTTESAGGIIDRFMGGDVDGSTDGGASSVDGISQKAKATDPYDELLKDKKSFSGTDNSSLKGDNSSYFNFDDNTYQQEANNQVEDGAIATEKNSATNTNAEAESGGDKNTLEEAGNENKGPETDPVPNWDPDISENNKSEIVGSDADSLEENSEKEGSENNESVESDTKSNNNNGTNLEKVVSETAIDNTDSPETLSAESNDYETEGGGQESVETKETDFKYEIKLGDTLSEVVNDRLHERFDQANLSIPDEIGKNDLSHYMYSMFPEMTEATDISPRLTPEQWQELGVSSGNPNLIKPGETINVDMLIDKYMSAESIGVDSEMSTSGTLDNNKIESYGVKVVADNTDVIKNQIDTNNNSDWKIDKGSTGEEAVETESGDWKIDKGSTGDEATDSGVELENDNFKGNYRLSDRLIKAEYSFVDSEVVGFDHDSSVITEKLSSLLRSGIENGDIVLPDKVAEVVLNNETAAENLIRAVLPDSNIFENNGTSLMLSSEEWQKLGIKSGDPRYLDVTDTFKSGEAMYLILDKLFGSNPEDISGIISGDGKDVVKVYNI